MSSLPLALQNYSEFLRNFFDGSRRRRNFLHNGQWLDGWRVGHITIEYLPKRRGIIGEKPRISSRNAETHCC
jgi:hypothetical protein